MDGPFVVAQDNIGNSGGTPVQVIKLFKPQPGKTEIFYAGTTGVVKIDFGAIADEKITLVHDTRNQSLHVVFADGSQNIIEPFFNSQGVMQNLILLMGSDHEITGAELAAHFGATEGRSVLPEEGNANVGSGAVFHDPTVDPLGPAEPLPLLLPQVPPGVLSPFVFHETLQAPPLATEIFIPPL